MFAGNNCSTALVLLLGSVRFLDMLSGDLPSGKLLQSRWIPAGDSPQASFGTVLQQLTTATLAKVAAFAG